MITADGKKVRNKMRTFKIGELSGVTRPAQKPALAVAIKHEPLKQENVMDPKDLKIAELEKAVKQLQLENALTDPQRVHYAKLLASQPQLASQWLEKSHEQREIVLDEIQKADTVLYTCVATGEEIRKSHGKAALTMAKQLDELSATNKANAVALENAGFAKMADDILGHFPGKPELKIAVIKAIHKGCEDEKIRGEILEKLKTINTGIGEGSIEVGTGDDGEPLVAKGPEGEYEALIAKTMTDQKVDRVGAIRFLDGSPELAKIYAKMVSSN